ncbi:hypothetical protein [Atlantibacter hermannii]|uniref:hypothetical protein n=1 Tax=Atlantibacter hermannii TaxID=565 RepID=UPI0028B2455C|nr:hypothetical protein [Atlantibacter hermannii]
MAKVRHKALQTAKLLVLNAKLYENEKQKPVTRYKISKNTLRNISGRKTIRPAFIAEVEYELTELGWMLIENHEDELCFMIMATTGSWAKLSSKRLTDLIMSDSEAIDEAYEELVENDL